MNEKAEKLRIFSVAMSLGFIAYYVINGGWWWIFWAFNLIVNTVLFVNDSQKRGKLNESARKTTTKTC